MAQQNTPTNNAFGNQPPVTVIVNPPKNGLATAGMVISIIGLCLGWVPFAGWLVIILGVIFSLIGVFSKPRGRAIAGLVISVISIVCCLVLWTAIMSQAS